MDAPDGFLGMPDMLQHVQEGDNVKPVLPEIQLEQIPIKDFQSKASS
jgi:hypothetical protein